MFFFIKVFIKRNLLDGMLENNFRLFDLKRSNFL